MDVPTAADVRTWTPASIEWDALGFPEGDPDPLALTVAQANTYVAWTIGRRLQEITPTTDPYVDLTPVVEQAIAMRTYQIVVQNSEDYLDTLGDFDLIQSFTAGGYSETRRSGVRLTRGGSEAGVPEVNPWPPLNQLLWLAMSDDRRDDWRFWISGITPPAWEIEEVSWGGYGSMYGYSEGIHLPGDLPTPYGQW